MNVKKHPSSSAKFDIKVSNETFEANNMETSCAIIFDDTTRKPVSDSSTTLEISYRSDRRVGGSPWFTSHRSDSIKVMYGTSVIPTRAEVTHAV